MKPAQLRVAMAPAWQSGNPYTGMLAAALTLRNARVLDWRYEVRPDRSDVFHAHWPGDVASIERLIGAVSGSTSRLYRVRAARRTGGAFVWTVHNLTNHEMPHPRLHDLFWWDLVRKVDAWISPNAHAVSEIVTRWPALERVPHAVIPLGHYRSTFSPSPRPEEAGDTRTALLFGKIRRYKGVDDLISAFERLPNADYRLLIAGLPRKELGESLVSMSSDPRITCDFRLIPDSEVPRLFARADLMVLPFRQITNSSSALLALSLGVPILATDLPAMRELQEQVGDQWVRLWSPEEPLEKALDRELSVDRPHGCPDLDRNAWPAIAESTIQLYESVT